MWALRPQLYGPNVVNIGLPPKQHHAIAAASAPVQPPRAAPAVRFPRERILLGRWRRRARQRLLQSHAGRVGRLVRVRQGWQVWRAWRAWTLARWHKRISAELHRWSVLMRLVARVWRALQAVHCEAVQRGTAARDHQVRQLCARCVLGWRGAVTQRAHKHRALLHYAMALSARCLLGWATWLAARRRKRPRARQRSLLCAHAAQRRALGQWAEAAAVRRGGEHRVRRARERWARGAAAAALAQWREARGALTRGARLLRRAYVFMAAQLLGRVCGGWRGLCTSRAATEAAIPRAQLRLLLLRREQMLHHWAELGAARLRARDMRALEESIAARLAARRAMARWAAAHAARARRGLQAVAAAALGRARVLQPPWQGWRCAFETRRASRETRASLARVLRAWRTRHRARTAHATDVRAGASLWRASLSERVLLAWREHARRELLCRRIVELESLKIFSRQCASALAAWRARAARESRAATAPPRARAAALRGAVARWRHLAVLEEAREATWRVAVRHRYFWALGRCFGDGWKQYLLLRRAKRRELAEASQRQLGVRRRALFARWRGAVARGTDASKQLGAADVAAAHAARQAAWPRWVAATGATRTARRARSSADARYRGALCWRVLRGWLGYACLRATRRDAKLQRLLAIKRTLGGALRARVLSAWVALHRDKAARRALFACHVAALRGRRALLALGALQAHTVRRRIAKQARCAATDAAARAAARRACGAWAARAAGWQHDRAEERRACELREAALRRRMWGGWARYHLRKQHKAAVLRGAAVAHQRRLRQAGCAQWLQVGLARRQLCIDAAAQHAAERAAGALRRVERFARHWRSLALHRRLLHTATAADAGRAPPPPMHGVSGTSLWPAGRAGWLHGARGWDPLALAAAQAGGGLDDAPPASAAAAAAAAAAATTLAKHRSLAPYHPPYHAHYAAHLPEGPLAVPRVGVDLPVAAGGGGGGGGSEASGESLLPPPRTRTAPRPLPKWDAPPQLPSAPPLACELPHVDWPAPSLPPPPLQPSLPTQLSQPLPPPPQQQQQQRFHHNIAPQPPPPPPTAPSTPACDAATPRHSKAATLEYGPPRSPPAAAMAWCGAAAADGEEYRERREYGSPHTCEGARRHVAAPEGAGAAPGADAIAAEIAAEIAQISTQLHGFASAREEWAADVRVLAQLREQATAAAAHEQGAACEAIRVVQAKMDAHAAAQSGQQRVVTRLASRIRELRRA